MFVPNKCLRCYKYSELWLHEKWCMFAYSELFAHWGISLTILSEDSQRKARNQRGHFLFSHFFLCVPVSPSCSWGICGMSMEISIEWCCSCIACVLKQVEVQVTGHDPDLLRDRRCCEFTEADQGTLKKRSAGIFHNITTDGAVTQIGLLVWNQSRLNYFSSATIWWVSLYQRTTLDQHFILCLPRELLSTAVRCPLVCFGEFATKVMV